MLTFLGSQLQIIDLSKSFLTDDDVSTCVTRKPLPNNVPRGTYTGF
jgi:hypothetical protein